MGQPEIVVVDYGVGNLLSVCRGLEYCGAKVITTQDPAVLVRADKVVLPGVGAFANAMQALHEKGLACALKDVAARDIPILGICLGMQLLFDVSEEFGTTEGLGIIPGRVVGVPLLAKSGERLKIPHIGWNALHPSGSADWQQTCLGEIKSGDYVYFVHSFAAEPVFSAHRLADCHYGENPLTAVVNKGRVTGCQFHPEKSGEIGLKILRRFCESA